MKVVKGVLCLLCLLTPPFGWVILFFYYLFKNAGSSGSSGRSRSSGSSLQRAKNFFEMLGGKR